MPVKKHTVERSSPSCVRARSSPRSACRCQWPSARSASPIRPSRWRIRYGALEEQEAKPLQLLEQETRASKVDERSSHPVAIPRLGRGSLGPEFSIWIQHCDATAEQGIGVPRLRLRISDEICAKMPWASSSAVEQGTLNPSALFRDQQTKSQEFRRNSWSWDALNRP